MDAPEPFALDVRKQPTIFRRLLPILLAIENNHPERVPVLSPEAQERRIAVVFVEDFPNLRQHLDDWLRLK